MDQMYLDLWLEKHAFTGHKFLNPTTFETFIPKVNCETEYFAETNAKKDRKQQILCEVFTPLSAVRSGLNSS